MLATALAAAAAVWCLSVRAAPHLQQLPAAHSLCYACVVFTLAQPTVWRAVTGWVPDEGRHCALKFAAADKIAHLIVECATASLTGADVPGIVQFHGLVDCAAALPPSDDASQTTFLMQFVQGMPEHLARGAGCVVMDYFEDSLAGALNRRAPACRTRQCGCSLASTLLRHMRTRAVKRTPAPLRRELPPCSITLMVYGRHMIIALRNIHGLLHTYHRDFKPDNLLVAGAGVDARLVVADCGLAQWAYPGKSNAFLHTCGCSPTVAAACLPAEGPA